MSEPTRLYKPRNLRFGPKLLRSSLVITAALAATIIGVALWGAYASVERLSEEIVVNAKYQVQSQMRLFFQPNILRLETLREWGEDGRVDLAEPEALNWVLMPMLDGMSEASSVHVADSKGRSYMLLKTAEGWRSRRTNPAELAGRVEWVSWSDARGRGDAEEVELAYDPRTRPWFEGAKAKAAARQPGRPRGPTPAEIHTTAPYEFATTKDIGVTQSIAWTGDDGLLYVAAIDVLLTDLSLFTSRLKPTENGKLIILHGDGRVLGLPRAPQFEILPNDSPEEVERKTLAIRESVYAQAEQLEIPEVSQAVAKWRVLSNADRKVFRFETRSGEWWARFHLPPKDLIEFDLWVGVLVPSEDMLGTVEFQQRVMIATGLLGLLAAAAVALWLDRRLSRDVATAVEEARQLGQYHLEHKIGEGGMGSVYRARHTMLRRPTAIKMIRADKSGNQRALARFEREVRLTSQLTHPNTIAIYDFGHTAEGVFYYAMELLTGKTLEALVRQWGPLEPARVAHVLRQVCGSLAEAHASGIVHRDIKPANIMLCERGGLLDVVKVLDFGLVKDTSSREDAELTQDGAITGTPQYISPEGIRDSTSVDARSDLYAVGAVGYFLLTGEVVFDGRTPMDLFDQHLRQTPVTPSERLGESLPSDLEAVILSCLAKSPDGRPASAERLAAEIDRCECARGWTQERAREWWSTHEPDVFARAKAVEAAQTDTRTVWLQERPGR